MSLTTTGPPSAVLMLEGPARGELMMLPATLPSEDGSGSLRLTSGSPVPSRPILSSATPTNWCTVATLVSTLWNSSAPGTGLSNQIGIVGESVYLHSLSIPKRRPIHCVLVRRLKLCGQDGIYISIYSMLFFIVGRSSRCQPAHFVGSVRGPARSLYHTRKYGGTPHASSELCPHPYTLRQPRRRTGSKACVEAFALNISALTKLSISDGTISGAVSTSGTSFATAPAGVSLVSFTWHGSITRDLSPGVVWDRRMRVVISFVFNFPSIGTDTHSLLPPSCLYYGWWYAPSS